MIRWVASLAAQMKESFMDKSDPPRSFGVFKPVGHTVIAFRTADAMEAAVAALLKQSFALADLVRYTPEEMAAQVQSDLHTASAIAAVGQELNLVKAHGELAHSGCSFLVVHAPDEPRTTQVDEVLRTCSAVAAQRYGNFIVEEVAAESQGKAQTFESPDRGLDLAIPGKTDR
jgi:hypothetical protein